MADFDFNSLIDAAKEAGYETEQLAAGRYPDAEVTHVQVSPTQKGGQQVGLRFKIVGGPKAGAGVWMNQNVPNPKDPKADPEKVKKAAAIFLRICASLGVQLGPDLEAAFKAVIGAHFDIELSYREYAGNQYSDVKIKGKAAGSAPVAAPVAAAPAVVESSLDDDLDALGDDRPV